MSGDDLVELKIFMKTVTIGTVEQWQIVLQYPDGRCRVSDQSFPTRAECEAGIERLAKEMRGNLTRMQ